MAPAPTTTKRMVALCHVPACQALSVASLHLVNRAAALGGSVAGSPFRVAGSLATPARGGMARNVRRAIGITETPPPIATDPGEAYLPPNGVARSVHSDLPTMLIGGVSALLLQALHPLAMAGVAEHSGYREDPLGRLRRTAAFVGTTTFGTVAEAEGAIAQVQRVHRRVRGTAPDGRPYSADDPELVTFIHVAEVHSFLASSRRYGPRPLTPEQCDRYYEEVATVAYALGAEWVPTTEREAESYLLRVRPELYAGPQAMEARDWLLRGVARRPTERAVYSLVLAAAVGVLPHWARRELGLSVVGPVDLLLDTAAVTPMTRALSAAVRWVVTPPA
jgi:uncharacterized protein (DUF2236 family)